jgi:putative membrane protein
MPTSVDRCFSEGDLLQIAEAVRSAETRTSGELVVQLAPRSRSWLLDRWLWAAALAIVSAVAALYLTRQNDWGISYSFTEAGFWGLVGFLAGFYGVHLWVGRPAARHRAVWRRALRSFAQLRPTRGNTAVLIFVSVDEASAAVVADRGIAGKLDAEYWQLPHGMIERAMRQGRHAEGIIEAIREIGDRLAQHYPPAAGDTNELPDAPEIVR